MKLMVNSNLKKSVCQRTYFSSLFNAFKSILLECIAVSIHGGVLRVKIR